MIIDKTRLGIPFFDESYGGVYRGRPVLCIGRSGSGKTIAGFQFLNQCIQEGDRGLMLSAWRAKDLAIVAEKAGFSFTDAIEGGQITILEYAAFMPGREFESSLTLPPESFIELQEIITSNNIRRIVLDTVVPWVAIPQAAQLAKHIYSFIHAIERMGVTALFTLPKPVSSMAFALKNRLEDQIPAVFTLEHENQKNRTLLINKYLGEVSLPPAIPISIEPGKGIVRRAGDAIERPAVAPAAPTAATPDRAQPPEPPQSSLSFLAAMKARQQKNQDDGNGGGPIRFSSAFR